MGQRRHPLQVKAATSDPQAEALKTSLRQSLHHSVFAHLTRLVPDPDHPGTVISYHLLELRLRARCYRRAARATGAQEAIGSG
jgi:hypothetical protein